MATSCRHLFRGVPRTQKKKGCLIHGSGPDGTAVTGSGDVVQSHPARGAKGEPRRWWTRHFARCRPQETEVPEGVDDLYLVGVVN